MVAWLILGLGIALTFGVLRRPETAQAICRFAASALGESLGMSVHYTQCSLEALTATLTLSGVKGTSIDGRGHEVSLEGVEVRLRPLQALAGGLQIERLRLTGLRIHWTTPADLVKAVSSPKGSGCWSRPLKLVHVEALEIQDASAEIDVPGGQVALQDIQIASKLSRGVYHLDVSTRGNVTWPHHAPVEVRTLAATLDLDVPRDRLQVGSFLAAVGGIEAKASGHIDNLCRPEPDLQLTVSAPLAELAQLGGLKGPLPTGDLDLHPSYRHTPLALSGQASVKGFAYQGFKAPPLTLRVSGDAQRLRIEALQLELDSQAVADITGTVEFKGRYPIDLEVQVKNGPFARVLDDADIAHSWVDFRATVGGRLQGHLLGGFLLAGSVAGDIVNFTVDNRGWDLPGPRERLLTVYPKVHVQTDVHIDKDALHFEHAHLRTTLSEAEADAQLSYDNRQGLKLSARLVHL